MNTLPNPQTAAYATLLQASIDNLTIALALPQKFTAEQSEEFRQKRAVLFKLSTDLKIQRLVKWQEQKLIEAETN